MNIIENRFGCYICHYNSETFEIVGIHFGRIFKKTVPGITQTVMHDCNSKTDSENRAAALVAQMKKVFAK